MTTIREAERDLLINTVDTTARYSAEEQLVEGHAE